MYLIKLFLPESRQHIVYKPIGVINVKLIVSIGKRDCDRFYNSKTDVA